MRSRGNFTDYGDNTTKENHLTTVKTLLPYLWPEGRADLRTRVVLSLSFLVLAKIVGVCIPFIFKEVIDLLNGPGDVDNMLLFMAAPTGLIIGYGIMRVTGLMFGELRDAVFVKVGQNALRTVALKTFRHMHQLSLRFHLERRTGGLSRVIERGTRGIDFLLRFLLFSILPTLLEIFLISAIFWAKFGFLYALITFGCLVSYIYYTIAITEWRLKFRREMNVQDTQANTKAVDSLLNFETVKYFTSEEHESTRYDRSLQRYEAAAVKSQRSLTLLNVGQGAIISAGLAVVLIMGAQGVKDGIFTIGDFVLINALLVQIYMPLNFLGMVYREIKQSLVDMEKMFSMVNEKSDVTDHPDAKEIIITDGAVTFENVSFHYNADRPILKNISFHVPGGTKTAIVGASGAGKSTISRILFRFYETSGGRVLVDGQDIREVTQKSLRQEIGVVPQDTVLFNDTIAYNIKYGRHDATEQEVVQAAELAQIDGFLKSLPEGYETQVGERGLKLSGGEKQRVAIARTILKNPAILLLDEATSALDSHTEQDIQVSLEKVSEKRTTLVIAHRLSTIINADEILVLDQGEIVERGSHEKLISEKGYYYRMWQKQQEMSAAMQKLAELEKTDDNHPVAG